jgi:3-oxoacyl-[acyl-carrier protein] reductase
MNRWVLVTGGAKNLGREIALKLAQSGFSVIIHYRTSSIDAEKVADVCRSYHIEARTLQGDFSTLEQAKALALAAKKLTGGLFGIVNNVGSYFWKSALVTPIEDAEKLFTTNFFTPIALIQESIEDIKKEKGVIVNIGSSGLVRQKADTYAPFYHASKQALLYLTRSFAKELAPFHVRVNMVSPGKLEHSIDLHDMSHSLPFGRPVRSEEVADMVSYLFSEKSMSITGQNIEVAGGFGL